MKIRIMTSSKTSLSLMTVSLITLSTFHVLHSEIGFWPNPPTLDLAGRQAREQHSSLLGSLVGYKENEVV